MHRITPALKLVAPLALVALIVTAFAGTAVAKPGGGAMKPAKVLVKSHMQLGQHYMMTGQFKQAIEHFQAVIDLQIDVSKDDELFAEAPEEAEEGDKRRKRRNPGKRLAKVKVKAHMAAAIASYKLGDEDAAEAYAEAGLSLAQSKGAKRGVKMFERFLDDPDAVIERAAPSVEALEARIKRAEEALAK